MGQLKILGSTLAVMVPIHGKGGKMSIAFLGVGKMGAPMVRHLLRVGQKVTVWNRTRERAEEFASQGARVASTPAEAAQSSETLMTSLFDDKAHEEVLLGQNGALEAMKPDALHVSLSTISVTLSERLTSEHDRRGQLFVGAPVFGRPNIAEQGRLWIVVGGADSAVARAKSVLEPLSRGISVVGDQPRQAHAVKLGGNFLISAMIHSLSEAFVFAEGQGISPDAFLEAVNNALFQSPFYAAYGNVMLHPPATPGALMELGAKDNRLLREAASSCKTRLSLAETLAAIFEDAQRAGLGHEDWAAAQYYMAQQRGKVKG